MTNIMLTLLLCLPLQGCFFIYVPGDVISAIGDGITGSSGDYCVDQTVRVGDRITTPNGHVIVTKLSGPSHGCKADRPIRADARLDT